jgi:hypothetical protein
LAFKGSAVTRWKWNEGARKPRQRRIARRKADDNFFRGRPATFSKVPTAKSPAASSASADNSKVMKIVFDSSPQVNVSRAEQKKVGLASDFGAKDQGCQIFLGT